VHLELAADEERVRHPRIIASVQLAASGIPTSRGITVGRVEVAQLAPGLWRWTVPHPAWTEGADWPQEVGCVYYEAPEAVVLIDPLVPPERDEFFRALDSDLERAARPLVILLTVPWHARSAGELAKRYDAVCGNPPAGVIALPIPSVDETIYWLPERHALVPGDTLFGTAAGGVVICPEGWLEDDTPAVLRASLRSLLELPVERILVSHGEPVLTGGHAALAEALGA